MELALILLRYVGERDDLIHKIDTGTHNPRLPIRVQPAGGVMLKVRFTTAAAFHLRESGLWDDQRLLTLDDDWVQVSATVLDAARSMAATYHREPN